MEGRKKEIQRQITDSGSVGQVRVAVNGRGLGPAVDLIGLLWKILEFSMTGFPRTFQQAVAHSSIWRALHVNYLRFTIPLTPLQKQACACTGTDSPIQGMHGTLYAQSLYTNVRSK